MVQRSDPLYPAPPDRRRRATNGHDAAANTKTPLISETSAMLSKQQVIDGITQINRSARRDWLEIFDIFALRRYLDHLQRTLEPRGGHSTWIRLGDTRAIVTKHPGW
jgi:hypothetical protein